MPATSPLTPAQVREKLYQTVSARGQLAAEDLKSGTRVNQDLGLDSLDLAELSMELEESFGVSLPDEVLSNPELTLGQLEAVLVAKCCPPHGSAG